MEDSIQMDNHSLGSENLAPEISSILWRIMYAAKMYSFRIKDRTSLDFLSHKETIGNYKNLQRLFGVIAVLKLMDTPRRGRGSRFIESKTSVHKRKEDDS
jgi:hypothetical protein